MKRRLGLRALTVAGLLSAAAAATLVTAGSASANVAQCNGIVASYGYVVGAKVTHACGHSAIPGPNGAIPNPLCLKDLMDLGVKRQHADNACAWA